jgi:hypothetical protein
VRSELENRTKTHSPRCDAEVDADGPLRGKFKRAGRDYPFLTSLLEPARKMVALHGPTLALTNVPSEEFNSARLIELSFWLAS